MYKNIPEELKTDKAWVNVWNGSKIPMQTKIRKAASAVSEETWGYFADAEKNVADGTYNGIGYVFHDNGLVGIDIDEGYTAEGFISPLAVDLIRKCGSYTEKSRSGRGFHILVKGTLPFKGRNNQQGVEMYQSSRYFIMTGRTFMFSEIIENQAAIDYIVETYFAQSEREQTQSSQRIYSPIYPKPKNGRVFLQPQYPAIQSGGRNVCLTSLAGQLHTQGYSGQDLYKELLRANQEACKPPLAVGEIQQIVRSVTKYRR